MINEPVLPKIFESVSISGAVVRDNSVTVTFAVELHILLQEFLLYFNLAKKRVIVRLGNTITSSMILI